MVGVFGPRGVHAVLYVAPVCKRGTALAATLCPAMVVWDVQVLTCRAGNAIRSHAVVSKILKTKHLTKVPTPTHLTVETLSRVVLFCSRVR